VARGQWTPVSRLIRCCIFSPSVRCNIRSACALRGKSAVGRGGNIQSIIFSRPMLQMLQAFQRSEQRSHPRKNHPGPPPLESSLMQSDLLIYCEHAPCFCLSPSRVVPRSTKELSYPQEKNAALAARSRAPAHARRAARARRAAGGGGAVAAPAGVPRRSRRTTHNTGAGAGASVGKTAGVLADEARRTA
jgi:hypothetical protein